MHFKQADKRRGAKWIGITAAILCVAIAGTGLSLGLVLINFVLEARGVSGLIIGLMTTTGGLAIVVVSPIAPRLIGRLGATSTLLAGIAIMAGSFFALYWVKALWLWFALRFLNGIGLAALLIVSELWINALVSSHRRGLVLGIYVAAQSLGFALGPAILAMIGAKGFLPFAVGTGLMLLSAVPTLAGTSTTPKIKEAALRSVWGFAIVLPSAMLAAFVFGAVEAGINLLPIYALRVGNGETIAALLASAVAVGNVVLQVPIGFISDRVDRRKVLLVCGAVALICTMVMPLIATEPTLFFTLLVVWGGLVAALYSVGLALLASHYGGAELAQANAAFVMLYSLGRLVGPAVVGTGIEVWNPQGFIVTIALFLAAYAGAAAFGIASSARGKAGAAT